MREAVIVSAVRLPTGKFLGTLKDFQAPELGALVVREAVRRAGIDPASVDECIMGNVVSAGPARRRLGKPRSKAGLADHVAALTINKVCGSGLKAVMLAHQGIQTGDIEIAVAGGMESMSNCPYLLPARARGVAHGSRQCRRFDDSRRPLVPVRELAHGQRGRDGGRRLQGVARAAGCVRRRESSTRCRRSHRRPIQGRDPAGRDSAEERRSARLRSRRIGPRRHDGGGPARTQAGVQEGRLGHGRECAAGQRRRRRARGHEQPSAHKPSASRRSRGSSRRPRAACNRKCC